MEEDHGQVIYYIAWYMLRVVHRKDKNIREVHSDVYRLIESNASTSRERYSLAVLPLGRVERAELVDLFYVKRPFFEMMCSVEAVFDQFLGKENVYGSGDVIVDDVAC